VYEIYRVERRPSQGATHIGRGGTGNVFKEGTAEAKAAQKAQGSAVADDSASEDLNKSKNKPKEEKSLAEKGKEWLLGKK